MRSRAIECHAPLSFESRFERIMLLLSPSYEKTRPSNVQQTILIVTSPSVNADRICLVEEIALEVGVLLTSLDRGHRSRSPMRRCCRDPRGWTMPTGRPHASCLRQLESYLRDTGMAGLASAWAMARRRLKEYRRKVNAATRCSGVCPHT